MDRTTLALAACQGMTDAELAQRGEQGYLKMRDRKRHYASMARGMAAVILESKEAMAKQAKTIADLKQQVAQLQATLAELQTLDAPVGDTSEAANLLANLGKK